MIGIDRGHNGDALRLAGAQLVVHDLAELVSCNVKSWGILNGPVALRLRRYDPEQEGRREALCTLGNGVFATRAHTDSPADHVHYPGTYLAGGYNRLTTKIDGREWRTRILSTYPTGSR